MLRRHGRRVNESQGVAAFQQDGCGARQALRNVYTNKGVKRQIHPDPDLPQRWLRGVGAVGSYSSA
jgi:hypothetical protein